MQTNNKLREALAGLLDVMHDMGIDEDTVAIAVESKHCHMHSKEHLDAIKKAKAALAEPVRNYEVGTVEEQANRWYWRYHVGHLCQSCPLGPRKWSEIGAGWFCFSEWLQKPYEEGGAK